MKQYLWIGYLLLSGSIINLKSEEDKYLYSNIIRFENILTKVHQNYIFQKQSDTLINNAIYGLLSNLQYGPQYIRLTNDDKIKDENDMDSIKNDIYIKKIDNQIGYIKINTLVNESVRLIDDYLKQTTKNNISGLIIDLRYSNGGNLKSCMNVAELFLKKGLKICSIKGREAHNNKEYYSSKKSIVPDSTKIIIIANRYTFFGSELIAAALSDNNRAIIIGDTTAGYGPISSYYPLDKMHLLKIATSFIYSPKGKCINNDKQTGGIIPSKFVKSDNFSPEMELLFEMGITEQYLKEAYNKDTDKFIEYIDNKFKEYYFNIMGKQHLSIFKYLSKAQIDSIKVKESELITKMIVDRIIADSSETINELNTIKFCKNKNVEIASDTILDQSTKLAITLIKKH